MYISRYKDNLISVEFHKLEEKSSKPYSVPYQCKYNLGPEDIEVIVESKTMALSEVLTTLSSASQNVARLTSEMKFLKWSMPLIVGIGITIIGIITALT